VAESVHPVSEQRQLIGVYHHHRFSSPPSLLSVPLGPPRRRDARRTGRDAEDLVAGENSANGLLPCLWVAGQWGLRAHSQRLRKDWGAQIQGHVAFWFRFFKKEKEMIFLFK
jgi:hypothetical protein